MQNAKHPTLLKNEGNITQSIGRYTRKTSKNKIFHPETSKMRMQNFTRIVYLYRK